jgi:hypothetical protein
MREFKEMLLTTSLRQEESTVEKRQVDAAELKQALEALHFACKQGKCDEADALAENLKGMSFNETTDPVIAKLCELIASLDYDEAIKKIEAVKLS